MLRFIVPLQSPQASEDWNRVSELCNITLQSILNQTHENYEVVLVCNEVPVAFNSHKKIKVILTDLPPPIGPGQVRMEDKWKKVRIGLSCYRSSADAYYMVVDGDDRVSSHLAEFVMNHDYQPGWYFNIGLILDWGYPWLYKRERFDLICGTSSIVYCPKELLPTGQDDPAENCHIIKYGHTRIKSFFDTQQAPLLPLPFDGAVYLLNTGENDSKTFYLGVKSRREQLKRLLSIKFITRKIKSEFYLWDI